MYETNIYHIMNLDAAISTIMTSNVESVTPEQKLIDLKHIYEKLDFHSHVPVVRDGKLIGIVSLINFMHAIQGATLDDSEEVYHNKTVNDIMTLNPTTIHPDTTIREAASILAKGNFHSLPVTSEGKINGIVTTTDLLKEILK